MINYIKNTNNNLCKGNIRNYIFTPTLMSYNIMATRKKKLEYTEKKRKKNEMIN